MSHVLVLGAGGWLGRRLTKRLLDQGREVVAVDARLDDFFPDRAVTRVIADIRDLSKYEAHLTDCETVFNCCGLQHPAQTADLYAVNRDAPAAVYAACLTHGVKTFAHISSIAVYGENADPTVPLDEHAPHKPVTHYGRSKAEGERKLRSLMQPNGTRLILLQPGVFYGDHPSKNLRDLFTTMRTSPIPIFSQDGFIRTYVDIETVVDALIASETRGTSGESYCVGDEEPLSTRAFYATISDALGIPLKMVRLPLLASRLAEWAAFIAGSFNIHLRLPTIIGEFGRHTFVSIKKAQADLGVVPHASSRDGLRRMVRSVS